MTAPHTSPAARRREVITVYAIGLFQGLSLVAFPAAAIVLTSKTGYDLQKNQYGLLFLPQVVLAIASSLALPALARRFGLKRVLLTGLIANTLAMSLLAGSYPLRAGAAAYPMLLLATASLGLGFGLTLGSTSTYAGAFKPMRLPAAETSAGKAAIPGLFWLFAAALVIYGLAETMFGNWGTTLLTGRGVKPDSADDALAAFWAAVTVGRLVIALVSGKIHSTRVYIVLPWAICGALLLAPTARSADAGIALFALGGLACSGFFPMTVGYGESTFPTIVELAAGWLIAAYQLGYGLAAFGAGALQNVISLTAIFRLVAVLVVPMAVLAAVIARRQGFG